MRIAFCQEVHLAPVWTSLRLQDPWLKSEPVRFPITGATITFVRASFSSICISDMSLYFHRAVGARWPNQPTNFFFFSPLRFRTRGFRRISSPEDCAIRRKKFCKKKKNERQNIFATSTIIEESRDFCDECWRVKESNSELMILKICLILN